MTYATNPVIHENQKLLGRGAISERTAICSPIELLILRLIVIRDRGRKIKNLATALFVRKINTYPGQAPTPQLPKAQRYIRGGFFLCSLWR